MSNPRRSSFSSDASANSKRQPNASQNLRPLAPKPLPPLPLTALPPPQTLLTGTTTPPSSGTTASTRRSPAPCAVCYRIGCQLPTHSAFSNLSLSSSSNSPDKPASSSSPRRDPIYASSYAYQLAQQYADPDAGASGAAPTYDLPLDAEMNTPEMHQLFHSWFVFQTREWFRIPRPAEITSDLICGPFFLPAMRDSLLCLSVLAASAAARQRQLGHQSGDVMSLTLLGRAIQQMRERIKSDPKHVSDTTITAAVFLWVANMYLEDIDAMKSHSSSIYAFVDSRGGLQKLGLAGAVARFIRWIDAIHTFIVPVPCRYLDILDPSPQSRVPSQRYGTYWERQSANANTPINNNVISTCKDTCRLLEFLEHTENEGISGAEYFRVFQQTCALFANSSVARARSHIHGRVNECISVATALIQFHCFCRMDRFSIVAKTNLTRLVTAIKATGGPSYWQKDLDLLTWLLFVVVMIPIDMEEKSWCLPFLCRVVVSKYCQEGKIRDTWLTELRDCLRQFVWCDVRLEKLFMITGVEIQRSLEKENQEEEDDDDDVNDEDD